MIEDFGSSFIETKFGNGSCELRVKRVSSENVILFLQKVLDAYNERLALSLRELEEDDGYEGLQ